MLNTEKKLQSRTILQKKSTTETKITARTIDRQLRNKRSQRYMDAMTKLDAGGNVNSGADALADIIASEFPDLEINGIMLGIVSKCYLGEPYEVHTLDISLSIVEHYKRGQSLPGGLQKARGLANNPAYEFVEVFTDRCVCVDSRGNPSVLED